MTENTDIFNFNLADSSTNSGEKEDIIKLKSKIPLPTLTDFNGLANRCRYVIGVNVIPAKTQIKKTFFEWKPYQNKPIPKQLHEEWKRNNAFADGMAIILGEVWFGPHKGEYLIFIDCDNLKAIEEFCTRNGKTVSITEIAQKMIVVDLLLLLML